jgi:hypothetical protein
MQLIRNMKTDSLDLTAASRVHLMEPQWNPMAEEQALDRVHRIGQRKKVIAIRYIVSSSIEEVSFRLHHNNHFQKTNPMGTQYVLALQKKKNKLIQQSLDTGPLSPEQILRERLKVRQVPQVTRACLPHSRFRIADISKCDIGAAIFSTIN